MLGRDSPIYANSDSVFGKNKLILPHDEEMVPGTQANILEVVQVP